MHAFYANRDTETESSSTDKMTALFCLDLKQHGGGVDSTNFLNDNYCNWEESEGITV